eukprot:CAMPEP_0168173674 /NCGR_PEP_ID=MMETSP0139_2-20121125/6041_1 /TAXON_ID=44445 /ORGANISM="Pseudo-nitzschia australis, Strain 10249 10 AB" /LENGTH=130 /DNA_ID=CAMNT_0008091663 /DNA_START=156 /DNA_END=548 /DNA_ORIENTATION=+
MVVNFIRKCCWLLGSQLSVGQYNAIVIVIIVIVGSRSGCSLLWCYGCITWREARHGGNNLDNRGRVDVVDIGGNDLDTGHAGAVDVDKGSLIVAVADMVGVACDMLPASDMLVVVLIVAAMVGGQRDSFA